jgi:hypothetical protein
MSIWGLGSVLGLTMFNHQLTFEVSAIGDKLFGWLTYSLPTKWFGPKAPKYALIGTVSDI